MVETHRENKKRRIHHKLWRIGKTQTAVCHYFLFEFQKAGIRAQRREILPPNCAQRLLLHGCGMSLSTTLMRTRAKVGTPCTVARGTSHVRNAFHMCVTDFRTYVIWSFGTPSVQGCTSSAWACMRPEHAFLQFFSTNGRSPHPQSICQKHSEQAPCSWRVPPKCKTSYTTSTLFGPNTRTYTSSSLKSRVIHWVHENSVLQKAIIFRR